MGGLGRTSWWVSVGLHAVALLVLRQMPVQAREAVELETVELVAPPEPKAPPPPDQPKPPEPEAKPEPAPEPEPQKAPQPLPKSDKAPPKAHAAVATATGPGSADAPTIAGDFSNEPPPAPVAAPMPSAPPPKPVENETPKCTEPLVKAKPLEPAQPVMTDAMREAGLAGKVRVELKIDAAGNVTSAKVLEGLGSGFDEAALQAARTTTFAPATRCGEAVASTFVIAIRFTL